jgi:predicted 3-demethylubiquinone-9 3-methyltransferase (glyoxalase superfamily)
MQQIDFCLGFDGQAEAEANIGVSLFGNSKLSGLPGGGEVVQTPQQQPAGDGQAHRAHNAVAT